MVTELHGPYRRRRVACMDLWLIDGWRLKAYGISHDGDTPSAALVAAARPIVQAALPNPPLSSRRYGVGFVGVHEGRTASVVFVDWWADEDELHHHVFVGPVDRPEQLRRAKGTDLTACVWDLAVLCFEREAWLSTVLQNPEGPDLEDYLRRRLDALI